MVQQTQSLADLKDLTRSAEPEEMWAWCYPDDTGVEVEGAESWA